jgi:hypothetical protein
MGDERNRTLGDAWQHAIGNVIAVLVFLFSFCWLYRHGAAGVLPDGTDPVVHRRRHCPVNRWKGGEMVFRHRVAVYAEPRAQSQAAKELVSCLSPRVV